MPDDFTILRRQLAECRSNLQDTQAELAGVRRELVSARTAASSSAMELGAAQTEIGRLRVELAAKPSESSMVQRMEALVNALSAARKSLAFIAADRDLDPWAIRAYARARADVAELALDGPPDPERDREQPGEAERP